MFKAYAHPNGHTAMAIVCFICEEPLGPEGSFCWVPKVGEHRADVYPLCGNASCNETCEVMAPPEQWRSFPVRTSLAYAHSNVMASDQLKG